MNTNHDELGRFTSGTGNSKILKAARKAHGRALGTAATLEAHRNAGKRDWKKMNDQAKTRFIKNAAKDLSSVKMAEHEAKKDFGSDWKKLTPEARKRHIKNYRDYRMGK